MRDAELPAVNRSLLIVRARQPFIDWINGLPRQPNEREMVWTLEDFNRDPACFLIPSCFDESDFDLALEHYLPHIAHELFVSIDRDDSRWPKKFGLKQFNEWFEVENHDSLHDLPNKEPIGYEDY